MRVEWHRDGLLFTAEVIEEDWGEEGKNYEVENITAGLDIEPSDDANMQRVCEWWGIDPVSSLAELVERFRDMLKEEAIERFQEANR